jgi:hypothetical protein
LPELDVRRIVFIKWLFRRMFLRVGVSPDPVSPNARTAQGLVAVEALTTYPLGYSAISLQQFFINVVRKLENYKLWFDVAPNMLADKIIIQADRSRSLAICVAKKQVDFPSIGAKPSG